MLEQIGVLPDVLAKIGYPGKFEYALHWRHGTGDLDSIYKVPKCFRYFRAMLTISLAASILKPPKES